MSTPRYRLLTTLIVSALHPNEPHPAGTEWAPKNVLDVKEADELVQVGYAEQVKGTSNAPLASLVLDREDAARKRKEALDRGEDPDADVVVTEKKQPPANTGDDEVLSLILEGNVDQVKAELDGLTVEQLLRLAELEGDAEQGGKQRKGVLEAIDAAVEAADKE